MTVLFTGVLAGGDNAAEEAEDSERNDDDGSTRWLNPVSGTSWASPSGRPSAVRPSQVSALTPTFMAFAEIDDGSSLIRFVAFSVACSELFPVSLIVFLLYRKIKHQDQMIEIEV